MLNMRLMIRLSCPLLSVAYELNHQETRGREYIGYQIPFLLNYFSSPSLYYSNKMEKVSTVIKELHQIEKNITIAQS